MNASARLALACLLLGACTAGRASLPDAGAMDTNTVTIPDTFVPDTGAVVCAVGLIDCAGTCSRVAADPMNCGSCGNVCPTGTGCAVGRCDCHAPHLACDGLCIDPSSDPQNCGTCANACRATEMCSMGQCIVMCTAVDHAVCVDTDSTGARTQVCADLQNDPMNCGTCNTRCAGGATCTVGVCTCPTGQTACSGQCVDMQTDPSNCGFCLASCGTGGTCAGGTCTTCGGGLTLCGTPPHCFDTTTSRLHCGACGHACQGGQACVAGACQCTGTLVDCGTGCTDLTSDPTHCGDCTTDCGPGGACASSTCTCATGFMMCGAGCTNVQTDRRNCGGCGNVCPGTEACVMGGCTTAPPTRYTESTPTATEAPWIEACAAPGHTSLLPTTDDNYAATTLPFPFRYWATDLPMGAPVDVCSNGFINLDGVASSSLSGSIPSTTAPNATIAAHWGDLVTGSAGICVATIGAAPNRQWVVEWSGTTYFGDRTAVLSFEIVLTENSGSIDVIFDTITNGVAHVTGVEDQTGANAVGGCAAGATSCAPTSGMRVRFDPTP